jgi:hypothetical protein
MTQFCLHFGTERVFLLRYIKYELSLTLVEIIEIEHFISEMIYKPNDFLYHCPNSSQSSAYIYIHKQNLSIISDTLFIF